jgi:hypothetical protein
MTLDVQKEHLWFVIRDWIGNDSGIFKWGKAFRWEQIETESAALSATDPIFIDNSYEDRQLEVFHASAKYKMIPIYGRKLQGIPFLESVKDPDSGTKQDTGTQIRTYTFNPDVFKPIYFNMLTGKGPGKWYVYERIEREYGRQVIAEECVDGVWQPRRGYPQNHLFDCEVYQVVGAAICGLIRVC